MARDSPRRSISRAAIPARGTRPCRTTTTPSSAFYASLKAQLTEFVATHGEQAAFAGDRGLQISGAGLGLPQAIVR